MRSKLGKMIAISALSVIVLVTIVATTLHFLQGVDGKIVIATGNPQYHDLAGTYQRDLEGNGVNLELRDTTEGFATLKELVDDKSGVNAGFVKGGLVGSLQGRLASPKAKEWRAAQIGKWLSVGRLFYEPIWVFTRGDLPIQTLRDLEHKRILVGLKDGGTRRIATQLLSANGVSANNATLIEEILAPDAKQLLAGKADAAVLVVSPDSDTDSAAPACAQYTPDEFRT